MKKKSTNLHFFRFLAAILVILSHSYPIVLGTKETEPLFLMTKGQLTFGGLAVAFFFYVSGYFAVFGVNKEKNALQYLKDRLVRLLPLLGVVTILTIVMGGFLTKLSLGEYLGNPLTWRYILNAFMIPIHNLPGVFLHQPYNSTVNGALWTLPVEFACYIACLIFIRIKSKLTTKSIIASIFVTLGIAIGYYLSFSIEMIITILRPCVMFYIGMLYALYQNKIKKSLFLFILSVIALGTTSLFGGLDIALFIAFSYVIYYLSFYTKIQIPNKIANIGNISYAMYLVGFPIQQCLVELKLTILPVENFIFSLLLDVIIAIVITLISNRGIRFIVIHKKEIKNGKSKTE